MTNIKRPIVASESPTTTQTFLANGTLDHGTLVKMGTSDGKLVQTSTAGEPVIGTTDYDDRVIADTEQAFYADGARVAVNLFGIVRKAIAGGAITQGTYVRLGTGGKLVAEATALTKTVNTVGVALENATTDAQFNYLSYNG